MIKRILLVLMAVTLISVPAFAALNRPEFDAVGDDSANVFVDQILNAIILNSIDGFGQQINLFSDFTKTAGPSFNPTGFQPGPAFAEFFVESAGTLFPDPCFSFILKNDFGSAAHVPYLSGLTTEYNQGLYRWRITLQMKPESDLNINIFDCVMKDAVTNIWQYADQTGFYRQPWGQLVFSLAANPTITAYAIPGPYATPGFTTPFILDARTQPLLTATALFNALYTSKAFFDEAIVVAIPFTGNTNTSAQSVYDLHQGDMIDIQVAIPYNNTVDIRYGADNVFLKYIGIVGTEYSSNGL